MSTWSRTSLIRSAAIGIAASLLGCPGHHIADGKGASEKASSEVVGTTKEQIVVVPTGRSNPEEARNQAAGAYFQGRNYLAWVSTDSDHSINVASTGVLCPYDSWNQPPDYDKKVFSAERGSDDDKAGVGMAATADRLFLVYAGIDNNVYLKWMFRDASGDQWSAPVQVPSSGQEDDAPAVAVIAGTVYVAFTDTSNFIWVAHGTFPIGTPQATDTIDFDYTVTLPHDPGNLHRTDWGPGMTFYHSNFTDLTQPAKDNLLLAYTSQTQCTEGLRQRCQRLVLNFLDTTSNSTLAHPLAVEFSRIFDDDKNKNDFEFTPNLLGLSDGVAVAFRQDRGGGDDHMINVHEFTDDDLVNLYGNALAAGPGNVYGDFPDEAGVPFRNGVNITGEFTAHSPNLAGLPVCDAANSNNVVTPIQLQPALVWPGQSNNFLNVRSTIVGTGCGVPFSYAFDDTTDQTTSYANARIGARKQEVIQDFACKLPVLDPKTGNSINSASSSAMARLFLSSVTGSDQCPGSTTSATQEAENWITQQSCLGSNGKFIDIGTFGEWDVNSADFVRMFYQWPSTNTDLTTRNFLLKLVDGSSQGCGPHFRENPVGVLHNGDESAEGAPFSFSKETENHILFIESNRYLYNQTGLLGSYPGNPTDNATSNDGYTVAQWLQTRLQAILQGYFYEYNSAAAYEKYSPYAISNLFEYSQSVPIETLSRMILDTAAAHEALSTKDLRRMAPFRRHPTDWDPNLLLPDPHAVWGHEDRDRYQILTGESRMLGKACPDDHNVNLVGTVLGTYQMPDPILDRLINRKHQRGFGRIHLTDRGSLVMHPNTDSNRADGWEVYFQDPDFLISGGGIATRNQYDHDCDFGATGAVCKAEGENGQDVWTTVMPTGTFTNSALTLRIEQPRELNTNQEYNLDDGNIPDWRKTCVGPNFACGRHVVIPANLCQDSSRAPGFTFIDFTANCTGGLKPADTERGHGFYAAVYQSPTDDWGFFEVEGVNTIGASITTLTQFEDAVLARNPNPNWSSGSTNTYATLQGDTLQFAPISRFDQWNLTANTRNCDAAVNPTACRATVVPIIDGTAPSSDSWLAEGDFITDTDPLTGTRNPTRRWIQNPYTCQQLIMDFSDAFDPFYVDPQNPANRLCAPVGGTCQPSCTATPTGACSCPPTSCPPPSNVTGAMPADQCGGFFAQFSIGPATCPAQVGLWSPSPALGESSATVVLSGGSPGVSLPNGAQAGAPAAGMQIDFPPLPVTIPPGCTSQGTSAATQVVCSPIGSGGLLDLVPGRYANVAVASGGTLVLHPGDYMFDVLQLDSGATLDLPAGQRVRVTTKTSVELAAAVTCYDATGVVKCDADATTSNFGVIDLGTSPVFVNTSLAGTVVAQNAPVTVLPSADASSGVCSFTVRENDWSDDDAREGKITFVNNGPASSSDYKVEFDLPPGLHCTTRDLPAGATLSPTTASAAPPAASRAIRSPSPRTATTTTPRPRWARSASRTTGRRPPRATRSSSISPPARTARRPPSPAARHCSRSLGRRTPITRSRTTASSSGPTVPRSPRVPPSPSTTRRMSRSTSTPRATSC